MAALDLALVKPIYSRMTTYFVQSGDFRAQVDADSVEDALMAAFQMMPEVIDLGTITEITTDGFCESEACHPDHRFVLTETYLQKIGCMRKD